LFSKKKRRRGKNLGKFFGQKKKPGPRKISVKKARKKTRRARREFKDERADNVEREFCRRKTLEEGVPAGGGNADASVLGKRRRGEKGPSIRGKLTCVVGALSHLEKEKNQRRISQNRSEGKKTPTPGGGGKKPLPTVKKSSGEGENKVSILPTPWILAGKSRRILQGGPGVPSNENHRRKKGA